jgi:hypothetical protein
MRRKLLTLGLLIILVGVYVLEQGPQMLAPMAEALGFVTYTQSVTSLMAPTLLEVPASSYTALSEPLNGNVQVKGYLEVSDGREIAFYVMNEGNFSEWRIGHPSAIVLAKPLAITYNFTFVPRTSGTYYFVFDNQDTVRRTVIFSLNTVEVRAVLSPVVEYAAYELLLVGIVFALLGVKTGKKMAKRQPAKDAWSCKFCGEDNSGSNVFCSKCGRSQR